MGFLYLRMPPKYKPFIWNHMWAWRLQFH